MQMEIMRIDRVLQPPALHLWVLGYAARVARSTLQFQIACKTPNINWCSSQHVLIILGSLLAWTIRFYTEFFP